MDPERNAAKLLSDVARLARFARLRTSYPDIADLGVVGDRHSAAVVARDGSVVWYCPGRFDAPSVLAGLLDPAIGGSWRIDLPGARPAHRRYIGDSTVLETELHHRDGTLTVTDWMNLPRPDAPGRTLCRRFTAAPADYRLVLTPRPDYTWRVPRLRRATPDRVMIDERFQLQASHPVSTRGAAAVVSVPRGERAWVVLSDSAAGTFFASEPELDRWLAATLEGWRQLAARCSYEGPFAAQVRASLRALRLLVYEDTGAIAASVTTSLPEVVGGKRNFDYRYTWLRDSGMIVRALTRFEPEGAEALHHLEFIARVCGTGYSELLDPVSAVGGERVPAQARLKVAGYRGSRPAFAGNKAARQLQLGSLANFLLGALETYQKVEPRRHWEVVSAAADFLMRNWRRRDSGIWEQKERRHFTSSKAFAACALEGMAGFAEDPPQAEAWRATAREIRAYIARECRTKEGGYAATAGGEGVDISAALFPVWGFTAPDDPAMDATIRELDDRYASGDGLYHRHLESRRAARREGAFLTGTFWIAHYWAVRGDLDRARRLIEAGLSYANDLGLFPEEIDGSSGAMLGNIPLGLVHASFLSAVHDYQEKM